MLIHWKRQWRLFGHGWTWVYLDNEKHDREGCWKWIHAGPLYIEWKIKGEPLL